MNARNRILLVEDDREIGELISNYFRQHDMEVVVVVNGREMDAALAANRFDLMLLDLSLPGEDGFSI